MNLVLNLLLILDEPRFDEQRFFVVWCHFTSEKLHTVKLFESKYYMCLLYLQNMYQCEWQKNFKGVRFKRFVAMYYFLLVKLSSQQHRLLELGSPKLSIPNTLNQ